jgi:hypothetical protein
VSVSLNASIAKTNSVHYHMLIAYVRVGALPDSAFNPPVLLFSPNPDGTVRRVELATVQDGFRALHHGLEGFCLDHPEWHLAFHSLSRAMLDPAPEHIQAAREALDLLATLTRIEMLNQMKKRAGREAGHQSLH